MGNQDTQSGRKRKTILTAPSENLNFYSICRSKKYLSGTDGWSGIDSGVLVQLNHSSVETLSHSISAILTMGISDELQRQ